MTDLPVLAGALRTTVAAIFADDDEPSLAVLRFPGVGEPAREAFLRGVEQGIGRLPPHDRETVRLALGIVEHVMERAGVG